MFIFLAYLLVFHIKKSMMLLWGFLAVLLLGIRYNMRKSKRVLICLGSGGHTTEMLTLIKKLPKHIARMYVMASTDATSLAKIEKV